MGPATMMQSDPLFGRGALFFAIEGLDLGRICRPRQNGTGEWACDIGAGLCTIAVVQPRGS